MAVAALLVVAYVLLILVDARSKGNIRTGDTDNLVAGTRQALECLRSGTWVGCGRTEGSPHSGVFPYPLLQYLPAALLVELGLSDFDVLKQLATLNLVAFAACFALVAWAYRRRPALGALAAAAILGGAGTYQSTAAFGEMLAAAAVLAAIVAALERWPPAIVVTFALACLGKETLPPFLLLFGLIATRDPGDALLPAKRLLRPLLAGILLGVGLSSAFNLFRFGSFRNTSYLDPMFRTKGLSNQLEFLAGGWFSPTAGILWFWPAASLVLLISLGFGLAKLWRAPRQWRSWAPTLALGAGVVSFTVGLAAWVAPFGWIAYGPRLAAPLLPAAVVLALHVEADAFESLLAAGRRHLSALVLVALAVTAIGWPQFGAPWRYHATIQKLIAPQGDCPKMTEYSIADEALYYRCVSRTMWRFPPEVLGAASRGGGGVADLSRAAAAEATLLLVFAASALTTQRRRPKTPFPAATEPCRDGITVPLLDHQQVQHDPAVAAASPRRP